MTGVEPYAEYREVADSWFSRVPAHWEAKRLKNAVASTQTGVWGDDPKGDGTDVLCVRVADFDRPRLRASDEIRTVRSVRPADLAPRLLRAGDLLLEKSGGTGINPVGFVAMFDGLDSPAVSSNFVTRLRVREDQASRYWLYSFAASYSTRLTARSVKQTTGIQNLDQASLLSEPFPFPPLPEQHAIADYLDRETAQIDALIVRQERLIETLRERRAAVVEQTITSNQRNSTSRLKHYAVAVNQGWSPQCYPWPADGVETWAVLRAGAANAGRFRATENKELPEDETPRPDAVVQRGQLVVSRANTRELVGSAAVVDGDFPRLMLSDKLYAFTLDSRSALPEYVARALGTRRWRDLIEIEAGGTSPSMQNISQSAIANLPMALPPLDEQRRIVAYLDEQTAKIDALIARAKRFIEVSKERRSALITAAVTGQIDVRGRVGSAGAQSLSTSSAEQEVPA